MSWYNRSLKHKRAKKLNYTPPTITGLDNYFSFLQGVRSRIMTKFCTASRANGFLTDLRVFGIHL